MSRNTTIDDERKPPTKGDGYMPRIGEGLTFWSNKTNDEFEVRNIWVHEDGTTYIRYKSHNKFLAETAAEVRQNFRDGIWEVISER